MFLFIIFYLGLLTTAKQYAVHTATSGHPNVRLVCADCGCTNPGRVEVWDSGRWNAVSDCGERFVSFYLDSVCEQLGFANGRGVETMKKQHELTSWPSNLDASPAGRIFVRYASCHTSDSSLCTCDAIAGSISKCGDYNANPPRDLSESKPYTHDLYITCSGTFQGQCSTTGTPYGSSQNPGPGTPSCRIGEDFRQSWNQRMADAGGAIGTMIGTWVLIVLAVFAYAFLNDIPIRPLSTFDLYCQEFGEVDGPVKLAKDYADGKVVFFNVLIQDMFLYWRAEHPLFFVWPPKGHPYTFKERLAVNFSVWTATAFWTVLFANATPRNLWGTMMTLLVISFPMTIFDSILKAFAVCHCVQGKGKMCRNVGEKIGLACLGVGVLIGIFHLILYLIWLGSAGEFFGGYTVLYISGLVGDWAIMENLKTVLFFAWGRWKDLQGDKEYAYTFQQYQLRKGVNVPSESVSQRVQQLPPSAPSTPQPVVQVQQQPPVVRPQQMWGQQQVSVPMVRNVPPVQPIVPVQIAPPAVQQRLVYPAPAVFPTAPVRPTVVPGRFGLGGAAVAVAGVPPPQQLQQGYHYSQHTVVVNGGVVAHDVRSSGYPQMR